MMAVSLDPCLSHKTARPPHPTRPQHALLQEVHQSEHFGGKARPKGVGSLSLANKVLHLAEQPISGPEGNIPLRQGTRGHGPGLRRYLAATLVASSHPQRLCPAGPLIAPTAHCPEPFDEAQSTTLKSSKYDDATVSAIRLEDASAKRL